jgi:hypothetical protein
MPMPPAAEHVQTVAFDESGNTKGNLLDTHQPSAVVGSCSLSEEAARDCLDTVRAATGQRGDHELHFVRLKSPRARQAILGALARPELTPDTVRIAVAHKRYTLVAKYVDVAIETMANRDGYDLYRDGQASSLAQVLYLTAPVVGEASRWNDFLKAFLQLCREPQPHRLEQLAAAADSWARSAGGLDGMEEVVRAAVPHALDGLLARDGEPLADPLDPALPLFADLAGSWTDDLGQFAVLHDHSEIIQRWSDTLYDLGSVADPTRPGFPLRRLGVIPGGLVADADSRDHPRLQLVDLIVGAVRSWTTPLARGEELTDMQSAFERVTSRWIRQGIWPQADAGFPRE